MLGKLARLVMGTIFLVLYSYVCVRMSQFFFFNQQARDLIHLKFEAMDFLKETIQVLIKTTGD